MPIEKPSRERPPPRCWACNRYGPNQKRLKMDGWKTRPLATDKGSTVEVYCPDCFAEYLWGDVLRVDVLGATA